MCPPTISTGNSISPRRAAFAPRGTRLVYTAWYDNSTGNPANPDPTKTVRWGPQTFDEMMLGYVEYFVPERGTLAQSPL